MKKPLALIFILIILILVMAGHQGKQIRATETSTPRPASEVAECKSKLTKANSLGIIKDMKIDQYGVTVVVDDAVFLGTQYNTKMGMVDTINCAFLDKGKVFATIDFVSSYTNRTIARYNWGTLTVE